MQKSATRDRSDLIAVAKPRQHFGTERKKTGIRKTIVFENNSFFFLFKEPSNRLADRASAPGILVPQQSFQLAIPINLAQNVAGFGAEPPFPGSLRPGTIRGHIKFYRALLANRFKHPGSQLRTVEQQK